MKRPTPTQPIDANVFRRLDALEWLIENEYEGNPKAFEAKTGIKMAQVGQWFSGYRALREKALRRLEECTNKPEGWFDEPKGSADMTAPSSFLSASGGPSNPVVEISSFRGKNKPNELVIPEYNTGGSMGGGLILRDQPGVIKGWSVSNEWVSKNIKSHSGAENLCIVTGFGDSMKGMFNSGDPIVVDTGVKVVDYDAVYFFRVADEGFIKRLQRIPGEGLRVLSENKQYDSWTIKTGMDFEVFGRVVKAWQGEDF